MPVMSDVRPARRSDIEAIRTIVSATLFPGELLDAMIEPFFMGSPTDRWLVHDDGQLVGGVAFLTHEPMTESSWNLKAIGVLPSRHRAGIGTKLMHAVETSARELGARLLLVDTSSSDDQVAARAFYERLDYTLVATIEHYWARDDAKLTFAKWF